MTKFNKAIIVNEFKDGDKTVITFRYTDKGVVRYATVTKGSKKYKQIFEPETKPEPETKQVVQLQKPIKEKHYKIKTLKVYKFISFEEMLQQIENIYLKAEKAFKINISMSMTLRNNVTGELREYEYSTNTRILHHPFTINNRKSLEAYFLELKKQDLVQMYLKRRPNSKWIFHKFTQYAIEIYRLEHTIGAPVSLPLYLVNNRAINSLNTFDDNLCFWRCLALQRGCKRIDRSTSQARKLFTEYYKSNDYKNYKGLDYINELTKVENHFKVSVNIYQLHDDKTTTLKLRSEAKHKEVLNVNLYENHFSYIKNIHMYTSNYKCENCQKIWKDLKGLTKHSKTCHGTVPLHKFIGGKFNLTDNIFDKLRKQHIWVDQAERFHDYYIVYDFECLLQDIEVQTTDHLRFDKEHVPVSVSICSNIEGYTKPYCIVDENNDLTAFIDHFINYLLEVADKAKQLLMPRYEETFQRIDKLVSKQRTEKYKNKYIKKFREPLMKWIEQIPVVGFNSSKYDINAIKNELFNALIKNDQAPDFTVKKTSTYMCISTQNLKFLDICAYLAPGYSYDKYIKAYDCDMQKGFFPYEWFDSTDKLSYKKLPKHADFYSSLKDKNITEEEYKYCKDMWKKHNMKTFKDFLIWYNDLDVVPFVQAIGKMFDFYRAKNLDLFKDGLSVPGLTMKYLFKSSPDAKFWLFSEDDNDLYYTFKNNLVGGASIIFNRYSEKNKTKIRGGKTCKKILGLDANALYLGAIAQEMPTGEYRRPPVDQSIEYYKKQIMTDKLFGFLEVDIHVPEHLKEKFSEWSPIYKNIDIEYKDLTDEMKKHVSPNYKQRSLIGSNKGEKILLYTPLLKFYIKHGLEITKIHQIIEYESKKCFKQFMNDVSNARREGDKDPNKAIIAETFKLFGNSSYGKTITNQLTHTNVNFVNDDKIMQHVNDPYFKSMNELNDSYEVVSTKKQIRLNLPLHIGIAVYQLSKLRMMQFYYECLDKYIDRSNFELCESDTDSLYMALSGESLDELVKPEMREEYEQDKWNWFPRPFCKDKCKKCKQCDEGAFYKRQPGLFKVEYEGDGICCLNSKTYYCWREDDYNKFSSKGVNKKTNNISKDIYLDVLKNKQSAMVTNRGFRAVNGLMRSYKQHKVGFSYFYAKRKVLADGIHTETLDL